MDERTKEKLLKAARIRMRLLEGRHSGLPAGADWMAALEEGRIASDRLEAEMVRQELHRVRVLAESLRMDRDAARAEARRAQEQAKASLQIPCAHCGKPFTPRNALHAYCSKECTRSAKRERAAARAASSAPAPTPVVSGGAVTDGGVHVCERMSLRTLSPLPCGTRVECFGEHRCGHCPEDASPVLPEVSCIPPVERWGIGRSVPAGDMA